MKLKNKKRLTNGLAPGFTLPTHKKIKQSNKSQLTQAEVSCTLPAIENILKWSKNDIIKYCKEWATLKRNDISATKYPISVTQANDLPCFAQVAVQYDQVDVLKLIAADTNQPLHNQLLSVDKERYNLLQLCIKYNSIRCFKYLSELQPDWKTEKLRSASQYLDQATIIHLAFYHGRKDILDYSLNVLCSIQHNLNKEQQTGAIFRALHKQAQISLLQQTTASGDTMAHLAARNNKIAVLSYLMKLNMTSMMLKKNRDGETAVQTAIRHGALAVFNYILNIKTLSQHLLNIKNPSSNICFYASLQTLQHSFYIIRDLICQHKDAMLATNSDSVSPMDNVAAQLGLIDCNTQTRKKIIAYFKQTNSDYPGVMQAFNPQYDAQQISTSRPLTA